MTGEAGEFLDEQASWDSKKGWVTLSMSDKDKAEEHFTSWNQ